MEGSFVQQLMQFLLSPLGITSCVLSLVLVVQARRARRAAWLLFTLCCFAASLGVYQDEFVRQAPALVFPLEQLRAAGRPLTVILLGMLLLTGFYPQMGWRASVLPRPVKFLLLVQAVIFLKTLFYGSALFALLTATTIGALVLMVYLGPSRWLQRELDFRLAVWSVAMVAVFFLGLNLYQAIFDVYPISFVQGRFLGTTGNPQHAAALLAGIVPCLIFMVEARPNSTGSKAFWLITLALTMFALLWTGSRTGLLMAAVTILFFYRLRAGQLLRIVLLMAVVAAIALAALNYYGFDWRDIAMPLQDRYASFANTRNEVWTSLWRSFQGNLIFGTPLQGDRLFGYGESSWLGAAAALGLVGLIPLCLAGLESLRMMVQLFQLSRQQPAYFYHASTVLAGLATLFVGSLFEAYLLGNLGANILLLYFYWALGQYLVDVKEYAVASAAGSNVHRATHYLASRTMPRTMLANRGKMP
ncbi:MAG: O-antigen ligase family protein [Caldilineaceae bacterium]|nr:O-antigen ligase family protein [Caldilineaceae bacterium]